MASIALINIGNELLKGSTINTNAATIGELLRSFGYALGHTEVIPDNPQAIKSSIKRLMQAFPAVIMTGGLGPTKDDLTKQVLLEIFGGEMKLHEPSLAIIEQLFKRANRKVNPHSKAQAYVPDSCEVLLNELGTAPGMAFEKNEKVLIALPGVPFEMKTLLRQKVIPFLNQKVVAASFHRIVFRTFGLPESEMAAKMEEIEEKIPENISIAYLPDYAGVKVELSGFDEEGGSEFSARLEAASQLVKTHLAQYIYAESSASPAKLLAEHLLRHNISFSTAESCTGGKIAAKLVEYSGISTVFRGSVVAYQIPTKTELLGVERSTIKKYGVVSEEVAKTMAKQACIKLNSEVSISITGYLEPAEGQKAEAWIGYADAKQNFARQLFFVHNRKVNIERAANAALILCLKALQLK